MRLDRLDSLRDDEAWLAQTLDSPAARFVPLWRSRNLLASGDNGEVAVYLEPGELDRLDSVQPPTLLGTDGKRFFFAVSINDAQRETILSQRPQARFVDLRRASMNMDAKHAGVLAYAKALHYWQHRHGFCGACGSPNLLRSSGHKLVCSNDECARQTFPRIDPAIIVLVTHGDACLLGHNAAWPAKRYSTLAGFVEPGESLEDAVVREVYEEARVRLTGMRYVSSQPWPFPASAMCGFYAEAENRDCESTDEMEEVLWLNVDELKSAILDGSVRLPPPVSIAFQLIADWYRGRSGGALEDVVAEAKERAGAKVLTFRD
ncbi:MAG: NAD(+) diphosphatase [Xanthomonadales bacterium]|nr:NAD(+) diphosphatase [Xanthomonadales bacterium]